MNKPIQFHFSFGPWNISEDEDLFGPATRLPFSHEEKFALFSSLGFEGAQFYDDVVVPGLESMTAPQALQKSAEVGADVIKADPTDDVKLYHCRPIGIESGPDWDGLS